MSVTSLPRRLAGRVARAAGGLRERAVAAAAARALRADGDPEPLDHEFEAFQNAYPVQKDYGYGHFDKWERAMRRARYFLEAAEVLQTPGLTVLELGCGDGTLGRVLSEYPHNVVLSDLDDWRDEGVRHLPFVKGDVCEGLDLDDGSVDAVVSYNTFEHVGDPQAAFDEIVRVCRPGGHVRLAFGPLYASPWGLHAYRSLLMPYPQYLFSEGFVREKLREIGIRDLGEDRDELQPLNGWTPGRFCALWADGPVRVVSEGFNVDRSHLDVVAQNPGAFRGRGLTLRDVTTANVYVTLQRL